MERRTEFLRSVQRLDPLVAADLAAKWDKESHESTFIDEDTGDALLAAPIPIKMASEAVDWLKGDPEGQSQRGPGGILGAPNASRRTRQSMGRPVAFGLAGHDVLEPV